MKRLLIILISIIIYYIVNNLLLFLNVSPEIIKIVELVSIFSFLILLEKKLLIKKITNLYKNKINSLFTINTKIQEENEINIKPRAGALKGLKSKFYGIGYSIQLHDFNLHDPMIYISDEINLNLGQEIPFLIFRPMHVNPKNQNLIKIDKKRILTNYMDMTQAERTAYLFWISRGRTGTVENYSFVSLYIKGLSYRFFEENKNKKEIYLEVVRLYQEYGANFIDISKECLNLIELFLHDGDVVRMYNLMDWQDIIKNKFKLEFNNDKYYSFMWSVITLKKEPLNVENILWFYLRDPKVAKLIHNQQALECIKQILIEQFSEELIASVKIIRKKSEILLDNFIVKDNIFELDENSSLKIKKQIVKVIDELKFFLLSFHNHSFVESYSLLPVKYKKIIHHPLRDSILELYSKSSICSVKDILFCCNIVALEIDHLTSKNIAKILNDNFLAIEPDARITKKSYDIDQKVIIFKQGTNLLCKNLNYLKARLVIDTTYSASLNSISDELKTLILNFCIENWPDLKSEKDRLWSRMILLDDLKEEDLRLSLKTEINLNESNAFIDFLTINQDSFGIKDSRLSKIKELFSE